MQSNTNHVEESLDNDHYHVIVFEPEESFYHLDFDTRLKLLEDKINVAKEQAAKLPKGEMAIFVAPEYLFKDFSKQGPERYFTKEQKNTFLAKMQSLSVGSDMVIVPGTICWRSTHKHGNSEDVFYRNTAYLFHKGKSKGNKKYNGKYIKSEPDINSDFDYIFDSNTTNVSLGDPRFQLFKCGNADDNSPLMQVNDKIIGIEICIENLSGRLLKFLHKHNNPKIDIHLIIADGVEDPLLLDIKDLLLIKVERHSNQFAKVIGKVYIAEFCYYRTNVEEAPGERINDSKHNDLHIHKVSIPKKSIKTEESQNIPDEGDNPKLR